MEWFVNNWELCISFAVALFIAWMVFFKQEFESIKEREKINKKPDKKGKDKKDVQS